MKVSEVPLEALVDQLKGSGISLRTGPFITHVQTCLPSLIHALRFLYADFRLDDNGGLADFHVCVTTT
jgi:hypothetical protein